MRHSQQIALLLAAAAYGTAPVLATGPLRPVALTGTSGPLGPNLGPDITFSTMQMVKTVHVPEFGTYLPAGPSISNTGAVVFGGVLSGPGITTANGSGIFAARGGDGVSVVARRGNQIPGLPDGYLYDEFFRAPQICDTGAVTFLCTIRGNDSNVAKDESVFTERSGWPQPLLYEGVTIVPETDPPVVFGLRSDNYGGDPWGNNGWLLNRTGDTVTRCFIRDESGSLSSLFGIYGDIGGGPLVKHYRNGDTWTDGVETRQFSGSSNPRINDTGAIITLRLTDNAGLHPWTNRAVDGNGFGMPGVGPLHRIFTPGVTLAPGTGTPFASTWSLRDFHINNGGRIAFAAELNPGGPGAAGGFWSDGRFGALQLIAQSGAAAPGTPAGVQFNPFAQFILSSAMADNNVVAFQAMLWQSAGVGGGNDTGIWTTRSVATGQPGNLRLLVREGSPVPANAGPDYVGLNFGEFSRFWMNASGCVAFITQHNDFTQAIWVEQPDGTLRPIVKEFTLLDIYGDGSDVRLITTIDPIPVTASTSGGMATAFNDQGDIAVRIVFAGGSEGIFTTAAPVACDEPTETSAPEDQTVALGEEVVLSIGSSGSGPLRHQWRHNGVPIPGALFPTYIIANVGEDDQGTYDCVLENPCGTLVSSEAVVTIGVPCPADLSGSSDPNDPGYGAPDGQVDSADFFYYLDQFVAVNIAVADLSGSSDPNDAAYGVPDGTVDSADFFYYLDVFILGCP